MKTQMKTLFVFLMAAAIAVSCGKNESGGGSSSSSGINFGHVQNLDGNSRKALERLNSWYTNSHEGQINYGYPAFAKAQINYSGNTGQQCLKIFGENFCLNWGIGGGTSTPEYSEKTCILRGSDNVLRTKVVSKNTDCYYQTGGTVYKRSENHDLNELFSNSSALVPIHATENGNLVTVYMGYNNGYQVPVKIYVIDKNAHSVFNPIQVIDQSKNISTWLVY